jgi:hypothetical protein
MMREMISGKHVKECLWHAKDAESGSQRRYANGSGSNGYVADAESGSAKYAKEVEVDQRESMRRRWKADQLKVCEGGGKRISAKEVETNGKACEGGGKWISGKTKMTVYIDQSPQRNVDPPERGTSSDTDGRSTA